VAWSRLRLAALERCVFVRRILDQSCGCLASDTRSRYNS
jgi:hypothetical protein